MTILNGIMTWIESFTTTQTYIIVLAFVDFLMRMLKTDKPAGVIHMVSAFIGRLGDVCKKVAEVMDKILPQRLK